MGSAEEFVKAWQESSSVIEVAKKLGINTQSASARAVKFRKIGIPLKNFRSGQDQFSPEKIAQLTKLAESLSDGVAKEPGDGGGRK